MLLTNTAPYAIRGNIVCFEANKAICKKATVVINDDTISDFLPYNAELGIKVIKLSDNEVIFPGLADLHSHHTYNMISIWERPKNLPEPWDNRHEWRNCSAYDKAIKAPMKDLENKWNKKINDNGVTAGDLLLYFAEIQAVAGGTTVLQEPTQINVPDVVSVPGSNDFAEEFESIFTYNYFAEKTGLYADANLDGKYINTPHMLLRGTQSPRELGIITPGNAVINSVIDLFKPKNIDRDIQPYVDTSQWEISDRDWDNLEKYLTDISRGNKTNRGYIVHLAEGRAGVLKPNGRGRDSYSSKEVQTLISRLKDLVKNGKISKNSIKELHINLIHACGVDLNSKDTLQFLSDNGIGIIWSPVSNLLLYEDTPDFYEKLKDTQTTLGLGSDWSPSGSKHVWDECKFALKYLKHRCPHDNMLGENILKMVTINAAKLIGSEKIGNIKKGNFADLFVIKSPKNINGNINMALDAFYSSDDDSVQMVVIGGNLVYGEEEYFGLLDREGAIIPSESNKLKSKMVYLPKAWHVDLAADLVSLDSILGKASRSEFRSSEDKQYKEIIAKLERRFTAG